MNWNQAFAGNNITDVPIEDYVPSKKVRSKITNILNGSSSICDLGCGHAGGRAHHLKAIWESYALIREAIRNNDYSRPICKRCTGG